MMVQVIMLTISLETGIAELIGAQDKLETTNFAYLLEILEV